MELDLENIQRWTKTFEYGWVNHYMCVLCGTTILVRTDFKASKKDNKIKLEMALATGKKDYDKRAAAKDQDWNRQKQRIVRDHVR